MKVKFDAVLDLPVLRISEEYDEELDKAMEEAAKVGKTKAGGIFAAKYQWLEPRKHSQHIMRQFRTWKGKKQYGNSWLFGVAGDSRPEPNTKGGWENTLGGRAHFFEYGRSAPGGGRSALHDDASISRRLYNMVGGNDEAQPPRPFMRPAKATVSRKYNGITAKRLKRLAKKLNTRIK